jgi:hypothetical protein
VKDVVTKISKGRQAVFRITGPGKHFSRQSRDSGVIIVTKKMRNERTILWLLVVLVVALGCGWFMGRSTWTGPAKSKPAAAEFDESKANVPEWGKLGTSNERKASFRLDDDALQAGALSGQRTLRFNSLDDLEAFLKRAGDRIRVMGRVDGLKALRVSFLDPADFNSLLDGTEEQGFIYPAYTPNPSGGVVQDNAVPLGNNLLAWLGLKSADLTLGSGVKIALLDTGVVPHPAFGSAIENVMIVPGAENFEGWNGHGTATASLILGNSLSIPGSAPGAQLTSYRIADDNGTSDSWLMAQAIVQAADAGAQIISISMGSYGDSSLLRDAVFYAQQKNAVVVASSGNDGYTQSAYPAGYPGVISAVAVDAENNHLLFSNQASNTALSAPGWGVNAAYPGDAIVSFNGTSASAPIIAGSIAAVMSSHNLSASQAVAMIYQYTNETGAAGTDPLTGAGAVNLGRILQSDSGNIQDAAVASHFITPPAEGSSASVQVNIQNQGTTSLLNIPVTVTTPSGVTELTVASLAPGAVKSFNLSLPNSAFKNGAAVTVSSHITGADAVLYNNQRSTTYSPPPAP